MRSLHVNSMNYELQYCLINCEILLILFSHIIAMEGILEGN